MLQPVFQRHGGIRKAYLDNRLAAFVAVRISNLTDKVPDPFGLGQIFVYFHIADVYKRSRIDRPYIHIFHGIQIKIRNTVHFLCPFLNAAKTTSMINMINSKASNKLTSNNRSTKILSSRGIYSELKRKADTLLTRRTAIHIQSGVIRFLKSTTTAQRIETTQSSIIVSSPWWYYRNICCQALSF